MKKEKQYLFMKMRKSFIGSIVKKIRRKLVLYLKYHGCSICSDNVHLESIHGEKIEVREGTYIDKFSTIGSYTYIGRSCTISKANIGNYCSIANNVSIGQGEHSLEKISTSSIFYKDAYNVLTANECTISHDVWIGVDAIILRGVMIGTGAVIGANSVVTKDVPPFAVVVGSPAKIIKYRFKEEKIETILKSRWWDAAPDIATKIFEEVELNESVACNRLSS
ncbi:CatB-related O-acetyltransferase [Vibrio mediterranei]